ncbi:MAG: nitrous oxide-stimulated promoter family protein [Gammaproteobacteria bacterium]|nr:nitrous oxide-stimulated promoter family protein [Gammaproteobacteria bacterium]
MNETRHAVGSPPAPPVAPGPRIARERSTITAMIGIFCRDHHAPGEGLCDACNDLLAYASQRLEICPFQEDKPACNLCEVHCYSQKRRERVKEVMRYAGPRMLLRHPVLALRHLVDTRRPKPKSPVPPNR